MKNVILITNSYPFGNGETYIAPELEYANGVAHISIISMIEDKSSKHRKLPDNVKLLPLKHNKNCKISLIIQTILSKPFFKGLVELISNNRLTVLTIKELIKFVYASKVHYYTIKNTLRYNGINDYSKYIFYSYWMDSTSLSISYFKKYGAKSVTRCHGGDLYDDRLPWNHQFLRKYITEHVDFVCPVSIQGKEYLDKRIGFHDNVIAMHLGVLDNGVGTYDDSKIPIIVSCSSIIPLKRIELIIDALSQVKSKYKWIHFGDGPDFDKVKKLAFEKLDDKSFEFKGNRNNQEIVQFYKNNNVRMFINASSTEGVPVSIMEALSLGIPVIATDVGGVHEQIKSGYNGELVDKNISDKDLAISIEKILNADKTSYSELRKNSRASYCNNWSYIENYSKFYNILDI